MDFGISFAAQYHLIPAWAEILAFINSPFSLSFKSHADALIFIFASTFQPTLQVAMWASK